MKIIQNIDLFIISKILNISKSNKINLLDESQMKKMFLLFSHNLTQIQIDDVKNNLDVEKFVSLSQDLQELLSNIPSELISLKEYLLLFRNFLAENSNFIQTQRLDSRGLGN